MNDAVPRVLPQARRPAERSCGRSSEVVAILTENLPGFTRRPL